MGWGNDLSATGWESTTGWGTESADPHNDVQTPQAQDAAVNVNPQSKGWAPKENLDYEALKENVNKDSQGWGHAGRRYDYVPEDDQEEIGPKIPELEAILFKDEHRPARGVNFEGLKEVEIVTEGPAPVQPISKFESAGIHPVVLETVKMCKYKTPTPVQAYVIPAVLQGHDIVAVAQTGSGKTGAYLIPVLSTLMGKAKRIAKPRPSPQSYDPKVDAHCAEPLVLILCPTRELSVQIFDEARRFCYRSMLRPCVAYGGGPRGGQLAEIQRGCDILIGTPGRVRDFIMNCPQWLSLRRLRFTILDEADEMLKDNWDEEMSSMLGGGLSQTSQHQYMFFSATFAKPAREAAENYLESEHLFIKVGRVGAVPKDVIQKFVWVNEDLKKEALVDLLLAEAPCRTLVFVNSCNKADEIEDLLHHQNFPVTAIHSKRTQMEREHAINAFRYGHCPIMITSGVTARGIDVLKVMHIINFDLPSADHGGITEYVHRIGRTARIGNEGKATSFYNDRNEKLALPIVKILMEKEQAVPDFLEEFKPETLTFDEGEDDSGMASGIGSMDLNAGDGWGDSGTAANDGESGGWGFGNTDSGAQGNAWGSSGADSWGNSNEKSHSNNNVSSW